MGWRDAPIVKGAPEALQKPVDTTQTPGYRAAVTASETRARGTFQDTTRKGPDGKPIFGQVNTVTGEFRPYPKEMQPAPPAAPISATEQAKARADAAKRIQLARQLRENTSGLTGTGAFGPLFASLPIGATRAKDAEAIINSLEKKGAMSAVLDMLKRTGGKNPFTPMSQGEVAIIAGSELPEMGVGLSDELNRQSAMQIEEAATKAYRLLGGTPAQLEADIARLMGRATQSKKATDGVTVKRIR